MGGNHDSKAVKGYNHQNSQLQLTRYGNKYQLSCIILLKLNSILCYNTNMYDKKIETNN